MVLSYPGTGFSRVSQGAGLGTQVLVCRDPPLGLSPRRPPLLGHGFVPASPRGDGRHERGSREGAWLAELMLGSLRPSPPPCITLHPSPCGPGCHPAREEWEGGPKREVCEFSPGRLGTVRGALALPLLLHFRPQTCSPLPPLPRRATEPSTPPPSPLLQTRTPCMGQAQRWLSRNQGCSMQPLPLSTAAQQAALEVTMFSPTAHREAPELLSVWPGLYGKGLVPLSPRPAQERKRLELLSPRARLHGESLGLFQGRPAAQ